MSNVEHDKIEENRRLLQLVTSRSNLEMLGEEILSIWEDRVRSEVKSASDLLRPALRDALPKFLVFLAEALSEESSRGLFQEASDLVKEHAGERARESGYGPAQIVQEFQALRETVTSHLNRTLKLSEKDLETIQKTFDQAIQEALMEFFLVHASLREQFTATLSHDLRNPIAVSKMGGQLIQELASRVKEADLREHFLRLAGRIVNSMTRADRMIQDLLDASVLRIGEKIPVHISECDLLDIANGVVSEADEREKVRIHVSGSSTKGYWDCDGLRRSLENLVKNAIKYGDTEAPITVKVDRGPGRIYLSVHNQGNPIPEQEHKLIFRAFSRSQLARGGIKPGWGIGLALVRAVAETLGGAVTLVSSQAAGTTFTIELPEDSRVFQDPLGQVH